MESALWRWQHKYTTYSCNSTTWILPVWHFHKTLDVVANAGSARGRCPYGGQDILLSGRLPSERLSQYVLPPIGGNVAFPLEAVHHIFNIKYRVKQATSVLHATRRGRDGGCAQQALLTSLLQKGADIYPRGQQKTNLLRATCGRRYGRHNPHEMFT